MPIDDPNELKRVDEEIRRNELDARAEEMSGFLSDDCPPEVADQFLNSVERFENAPSVRHMDLLKRDGIDMPPPAELDDASLTAHLWDVINGLARQNTFLSETDHLSDRQLYELLYDDVLQEETKDLSGVPGYYCHLDLVSSGSDEDTQIWLKYYADEDSRKRWAEEWPDEPMPNHEDPPYARDELLPQPPSPAMFETDVEDFEDEDEDDGEAWKRGVTEE